MDEKEILRQIGARIREARLAANINQAEIATRMGTTQEAISRFEQGGRAVKVTDLYEFAEVLNVSIAYLLGLESTVPQVSDIANALMPVVTSAVGEAVTRLLIAQRRDMTDVHHKKIKGQDYFIITKSGIPIEVLSKADVDRMLVRSPRQSHKVPTPANEATDQADEVYAAILKEQIDYLLKQIWSERSQDFEASALSQFAEDN